MRAFASDNYAPAHPPVAKDRPASWDTIDLGFTKVGDDGIQVQIANNVRVEMARRDGGPTLVTVIPSPIG